MIAAHRPTALRRTLPLNPGLRCSPSGAGYERSGALVERGRRLPAIDRHSGVVAYDVPGLVVARLTTCCHVGMVGPGRSLTERDAVELQPRDTDDLRLDGLFVKLAEWDVVSGILGSPRHPAHAGRSPLTHDDRGTSQAGRRSAGHSSLRRAEPVSPSGAVAEVLALQPQRRSTNLGSTTRTGVAGTSHQLTTHHAGLRRAAQIGAAPAAGRRFVPAHLVRVRHVLPDFWTDQREEALHNWFELSPHSRV